MIFRFLNKNKAPNLLTQLDEWILYTKLFVGMGLNWYLEILAWATGSNMEGSMSQALVDCVNMMQVKCFMIGPGLIFSNISGLLDIPEFCVSEEGGPGDQEETEVHRGN